MMLGILILKTAFYGDKFSFDLQDDATEQEA